MNIIYIAVAAFFGGIFAALLGWFDSGGIFQPMKFSASIIRAIFAAVVLAIGYAYANGVSAIDIGVAFLGGAGIDVIGHRAEGAIEMGIEKVRWNNRRK